MQFEEQTGVSELDVLTGESAENPIALLNEDEPQEGEEEEAEMEEEQEEEAEEGEEEAIEEDAEEA